MKAFLSRFNSILTSGSLVSLLLLLVAFLLRAWGITEVGLWHDEALSHFYASQSPIWLLEKSATDLNHPPLFFLLLRGWIHLVPTYSPFWVELLNVLIGSLTVWVTWLWGRLFLGRATALAVAFIHALHPWAVHFSGELRMYALVGLSVGLLGYFSTRIMLCSRVGMTHWLGWTLAGLVSLYTHSFTVLMVAVTIPFVLVFGSGSRWQKSLAVGLLVLLYVPWVAPVLGQATNITTDYWLAPFHEYYPLVLFLFLGGWIGPKSMGVAGVLNTLTLSGVLGIPALGGFWRRRDGVILYLLCLVLVPVGLVTILSLLGQSVFLYRVFSPLVPVVLLLAGTGYEWMGRRTAVLLFLVYGLFLGWELVQFKFNPPRQYVRAVASGIKQRTNAGASNSYLVVHTSSFSYYPSRFYHGNWSHEKLLVPGSTASTGQITVAQLRERVSEGPVLLVYADRDPPEWVPTSRFRVRESVCWTRERTFCSRWVLPRHHPDFPRTP